MTPEETLIKLLLKRNSLYKKGSNDEKLNDKIREVQKIIRES